MIDEKILFTHLKSKPESPVKVSVVLLAYNQEKFIEQAINSILMQETNFNFEILIIEDYSTDNTRNIVIDYQKKYPDKIKLILSEKNNNDNKAWIDTIQNAKGTYVALLDGDDYWTSSKKLQTQADFLDSHPEISICFHNVEVYYNEANKSHPYYLPKPVYRISNYPPPLTSTLKDLVPGNFIQTCSVMFRSGLFNSIPNWFIDFPIGDWPLHIMNAEHGDLGYIDEILGAYRVHTGGLWSMNMSISREIGYIEKLIFMYNTIDRHLNYQYRAEVKSSITPLYFEAMAILFSERRYKQAWHYAGKYFKGLPLKRKVRQLALFKALLKGIFSQIYNFIRTFKINTA